MKKKLLALTEKAPKTKKFVLSNGEEVASLLELVDKLDTMEDAVFYHHVNVERNDFSIWIKDVYNDEETAQKVQQANNKKDLQIVLLKGMLAQRK